MIIKKLLVVFLVTLSLLENHAHAADEAGSAGILDNSLQDMSVVLGAGAAGAVLGLSTLSFVEEPSKHMKNIAVGAAIGVVIGVGVVVFSQATKSSTSYGSIPVKNQNDFEKLTKIEFTNNKIAKNYFRTPDINFNFSF